MTDTTDIAPQDTLREESLNLALIRLNAAHSLLDAARMGSDETIIARSLSMARIVYDEVQRVLQPLDLDARQSRHVTPSLAALSARLQAAAAPRRDAVRRNV